ncbi:MAG: nitroreductase family protein [Acidobacteriota bacterium]
MYERPAPADHPIHELLKRRWSTRAFTKQPLTDQELARLFEAARWAPSSGNGQPWSFILAKKEDTAAFETLASTLVPGNAWAREAGALILSVATLDRAPGKPNGHAWHDLGLASENLALQATAMGLGFHMMGGFNAQMARELLHIPDRWDPVSMMAVGHPAPSDTLSEALLIKETSPRQRKPIEEFVFTGSWGNPSSLK